MSVKDTLNRLIRKNHTSNIKVDTLNAGVHHFQRQMGDEKARIHLRLEPDGHGLLLVNASRSYHLNPTAAQMAFLALNDIPHQQAVETIKSLFHVSRKQADGDYDTFLAQFQELIRPDGACAICDLGLETTAPFSARPSAPYRMDLAITYRCNNDCAHCYNERPRARQELTTAEWKTVLDRLWDIGIPHIVFTGGEPTLRPDLPELIAHAQKLGQITGINTNGRKLLNQGFVQQLVDAGLDHVQITLESHLADIHDAMVSSPGAWQETTAGIKNVLDTKLFVMTNTTLLKANSPYILETLQFLSQIGIPTIGLNALIYSGHGKDVGTGLAESTLPSLLEKARRFTDQHNQRLIWYTPTQYCHFDPLQMDLGVKGCTAALYNMCIEPDGSAIPCQSYYQSLGNILKDPWDRIWNHELAISLRERRNLPQACLACSIVQECGGGCPLARQAMSVIPQTVEPLELRTLEAS
jgi:radical SAM protein with 4Fe4S-binding SPASM domain